MKIIAKDKNDIKIEYKYKITKNTVIRKNKGKTVNKLYLFNFPEELQKFLDIQDRNVYLYEHEERVYLTSRPPTCEYVKLKISKSNKMSVTTQYFNPAELDNVRLVADLSCEDPWRGGALGLVMMELF